MSGHIQPLSLQRNGTSRHATPRQAVSRECLLSSRSRVRVAVGAQIMQLDNEIRNVDRSIEVLLAGNHSQVMCRDRPAGGVTPLPASTARMWLLADLAAAPGRCGRPRPPCPAPAIPRPAPCTARRSARPPRSRSLPGGPAAIGQDGLAGDQRGGRGGQEYHHAGYFDGFADAVQRGDPLDDVRAELRVR
jgi:hypothetical protein